MPRSLAGVLSIALSAFLVGFAASRVEGGVMDRDPSTVEAAVSVRGFAGTMTRAPVPALTGNYVEPTAKQTAYAFSRYMPPARIDAPSRNS